MVEGKRIKPFPTGATQRSASGDCDATPAKPICYMRPPELDEKRAEAKPPPTGAHPMRDAEPMTDAERVLARILLCVLLTSLGPVVLFGWPRIAGAVLENNPGRAHFICYICVALASLTFSMAYSAYSTFRIGNMYPAEFTGVWLAITMVCALFSFVVLVLFILLMVFLFTHPIVVI